MAQIVRFVLTFISFVLILLVAVLILVIDHRIDRMIILLCIGLAVVCIGATLFITWVIRSKPRLERFSRWLTRQANRVISFFTRGRKKDLVKAATLLHFFGELNEDYVAISKDRRILIRPFIWAVLANLADVALIWIAFWSLGFMINPALLFVAFGLASIASAVSVTPGGAGVYETIMIAFLASSHVPAEVAIAGTLIARVTLVLGTILFGYVFYQLTVAKHGKHTPPQR